MKVKKASHAYIYIYMHTYLHNCTYIHTYAYMLYTCVMTEMVLEPDPSFRSHPYRRFLAFRGSIASRGAAGAAQALAGCLGCSFSPTRGHLFFPPKG